MNAEPEPYPSEALADEEPRYLRRQKPLEIRRRKFPRKNWPAYRRWLLVGAGIVGGGWAVYQGMRFFLYSPTVQLAHYDQIEISGIHYVNRSSITEKFSDDLGKTVLRIPLQARRTAIEGIPWVAQASARRVLPSRIRIEVIERVPVAFLRMPNDLALIDANGVILERPLEGDFRFPVVSGMDESMALADRAKRMGLLVKFLQEIDLARPSASEQISEVNLSDADDVRATIAGLPGLEEQSPVIVHFGDNDFINKYRLLLDNIGPWHASAGQVESVDLRFSRQVVVNPESGSGATASKLKTAARPVSVRAGGRVNERKNVMRTSAARSRATHTKSHNRILAKKH